MPINPQNELLLAEVYIDESSHTNHRYLVIGGIIVAAIDAPSACEIISAARLPELPHGVLKWTKVSRSKLAAYKRAVDTVFHLQQRMTFDFHSLVVDTTLQDHRAYNQGSREIGFNKEVYQLAMKIGRLYRCLLHIYPDRRSTNQKPEDLRLMLNRGIRKAGDQRDWPFRRVQFREPRDSQILQMVDVLTGAIAFWHNGHAKAPNVSPAKIELATYICQRAAVQPLIDTPRRGKFTIWHRRLR